MSLTKHLQYIVFALLATIVGQHVALAGPINQVCTGNALTIQVIFYSSSRLSSVRKQRWCLAILTGLLNIPL
jgi:hypothetical protein